jgi:hypothetical protein
VFTNISDKGGKAMKKEQMQTKSQKGGETMREWEVRFIDYGYTADEEGEKLWRYASELPKPEILLELKEECDCGDWPLHNNGGHYHYWWQIFRLDDEHYLVHKNSSREAFTPWEQGFVYISNGEVEYSIWTETIQECDACVCRKEEVFKEVESILQNYTVYISSGSLEALT